MERLLGLRVSRLQSTDVSEILSFFATKRAKSETEIVPVIANFQPDVAVDIAASFADDSGFISIRLFHKLHVPDVLNCLVHVVSFLLDVFRVC